MGNREDLLAGARTAILERGLAKVTARDIAAAAGVSLAAIGYHFGSKDRLVSEAITESVGTDVGDAMEAVIRKAGEGATPGESVAPAWDGMVEIARGKHEQLVLGLENAARIARSSPLQDDMAAATDDAYADLAAVLRESHPDLSNAAARAVAKLYFVLFQGHAVLSLTAPAGEMLDGRELAMAVEALRIK